FKFSSICWFRSCNSSGSDSSDSKLISTDIGNLASEVSSTDNIEIFEEEGGVVVMFDS
ncbi:4917_t:CDS:1, partial [Racocetra fulgida]